MECSSRVRPKVEISLTRSVRNSSVRNSYFTAALAVSSLASLTAVNASVVEAKSADSGVANGDVVYFQNMKEFEPRTWDDGSRQGGLPPRLNACGSKKAIRSLLWVES